MGIGRVLVFLIRSKNGWTRKLWEIVGKLCAEGQDHAPGESIPNGIVFPDYGVLLKMSVDGPFDSSARARWGSHSTVLIIVGGSGVSFGLSILEHMCLYISGQDHSEGFHGWGAKKFLTSRVRFVWLIRDLEFGKQSSPQI